MEIIMTLFQPIGNASAKGTDRVMAALIAGLEIDFGREAAEALAHRFLEAEEADFCWDARVQERWLGRYESLDDDEFELDRVAILGRLEDRWFVAMSIIDGDGMPHGLIGKRTFGTENEAQKYYSDAR